MDVVDVLLAHGARIDDVDTRGRTALAMFVNERESLFRNSVARPAFTTDRGGAAATAAASPPHQVASDHLRLASTVLRFPTPPTPFFHDSFVFGLGQVQVPAAQVEDPVCLKIVYRLLAAGADPCGQPSPKGCRSFASPALLARAAGNMKPARLLENYYGAQAYHTLRGAKTLSGFTVCGGSDVIGRVCAFLLMPEIFTKVISNAP